ncbi:hypothetical protein [Gimesia sp.]|uniref:hypothetical protein n=1 Tax=Gimesia sp. TaxID=2024833 RepID=UPI003A937FC3
MDHRFQIFTAKQPVFSRFALPETPPVRDVSLRVATHRNPSPRHRHCIALHRSSVNPYRHIIFFIST